MFAAVREHLVVLLAAWCSGLSLYLTVFLLGLSGRQGWIELPAGLEILEHPLVMGAALLAYAVEFVADKVPLVDSAWDSVHTFIRPAGAASLALMAGSEHAPAVRAALAVLAGTIALDMHALKASTRLAANTSPEPVSNIGLSLAEDSAVVGMFWFFAVHPVLATALVLLALVGSFFVIRALWRFVLRLFRRKPQPQAP